MHDWVCRSLRERELFGEGPRPGCTEEERCSWCRMKEDMKVHGCRNPVAVSELFGGSGVIEQNKEDPCCEYCEMTKEEFESLLNKALEDREIKRVEKEKEMLADSICLLEGLKHHSLEAHNKSIDMCIASLTDISNSAKPDHTNSVAKVLIEPPRFFHVPAVYARSLVRVTNSTTDWQRKYGKHAVCVWFRGKQSGIKYKIEIKYMKKRADMLSNKFDEIVGASSSYPGDKVLRGFLKATEVLDFDVYMEDGDGDWNHICIDGDFGLWPGDDVAALMMCLFDDLNTALEPAMYTLRGSGRYGMAAASKRAFMEGNSKASLHRLMAYEAAYDSIKEATKKMPTEDVHSLVSKLKQNFSDPEFANEARPEVDEAMLQEKALEGDWSGDGGRISDLEHMFG